MNIILRGNGRTLKLQQIGRRGPQGEPGTPGADGASEWGQLTGDIADQTDLQAALGAKEPTVSTGTTSQYWRGDKTWQTLNKTAVGLPNVDNTSDLNKPISTSTQAALDEKADESYVDTGLSDLELRAIAYGVAL